MVDLIVLACVVFAFGIVSRKLEGIAWALADQIGGNGFIAAFVGGLAIGPTAKSAGEARGKRGVDTPGIRLEPGSK